jgi:N-acetylglucosamine kinase-like BadF-type ATPase
MKVFAGIDGGQSSTVVAIGDELQTLARAAGPPADLVGEPRDSPRQLAALQAALDAGLDEAGLPRDTRFDSIVAGLSGFDAGISPKLDLGSRAERARIVHDSEIAHAGALDGEAGIVVIAGTGSVALGNAETGEPFVRAGGWGYFFGDEGSATWIARVALRRAMARSDRGEASPLRDRALAFFGTYSLRAVQHAFAHGDLTRPALASFAADVLALAEAGDPDARDVRAAAAGELADLVATVERHFPRAAITLVSYAGGLFHDPAFAEAFGDALQRAVPQAEVVEPASDPAAGALLLARRAP